MEKWKGKKVFVASKNTIQDIIDNNHNEHTIEDTIFRISCPIYS